MTTKDTKPKAAVIAAGGNGSMSTRDELRSKIFASKAFMTQEITLFGATVELRQPTLGQILSAQEEDDRKVGLLRLLVEYCFVPGTDERVFEDGDLESIMNMPFSKDIEELNKVMLGLTNIDVLGAEKNSGAALSGTTS